MWCSTYKLILHQAVVSLCYGRQGERRSGTRATLVATVFVEYMANVWPQHLLFASFPVGPDTAKQVFLLRKIYADVPDLLRLQGRD